MTAGGCLGNKGAFLFYFFKGIDILSRALSSINAILLFTVGEWCKSYNLFFWDLYLKLTFFWPFWCFPIFLSFLT